jgi:NADPH:quinone reductase-like Zn-dependent oxidoreductase
LFAARGVVDRELLRRFYLKHGYIDVRVVSAVGDRVREHATGDHVFALTRFGGYADCVVVPAHQAFAVPEGMSDAEAAAIPVNYLTAFMALYQMANLHPGETVLVHNAGGGVGIAATQLARLRRARILGTASAAKHDALRVFGVEHAIDYRHADVGREVKHLTNGRGADVILDPIGGASYLASYRMLAPLGRLVMYGASDVAPGERRHWWNTFRVMMRMPSFQALSLLNRNRGVFGLNLGHLWSERKPLAGAIAQLIDEFRAERLRPVIARTFPLDHAADAHRFIHARANIGKVILTT